MTDNIMQQSLLGALLMEPDAISDAGDACSPADFTGNMQPVAEAIWRLWDAHGKFDIATTSAEVEGKVATSVLEGLADMATVRPNVASYAHTIHNEGVKRRLFMLASDMQRKAKQPQADVTSLLDEYEQRVFELGKGVNTAESIRLGDVLSGMIAEGRQEPILQTGFAQLDSVIKGLYAGEMVVVAGRTSMGKTSMALNMVLNVATKQHKSIAIFSLETTVLEIGLNLVSMQLQSDIRSDEKQIVPAVLEDAGIYVCDKGSMTMPEIKAIARRLKAKHDISLIIVDYMQLISSDRQRTENRQQEITRISRQVKALAKELRIPVIAVSQLNRAPDKRVPPIPYLSDLRESGAIEQDADLVLLLYRPGYYGEARDPEAVDETLTKVIVAKHRHGPTGTVRLRFLPECMRFVGYASEDEEPPIWTHGSDPLPSDDVPF